MGQYFNCMLCGAITDEYFQFRGIDYYRCSYCCSVMMHPFFYPDPEHEKARYDQHHNDVYDPGYRNFVKPLVERITKHYKPESSALDYGAGHGPVITEMLKESGYWPLLFDIYYHNDRKVLSKTYDFIFCSEVIEHFRDPRREFVLLRSLIKPKGSLFCMTELFNDKINFATWHYKNDPTHLFFYHEKALHWIKDFFSFKELFIDNRVIHFTVD